MSFFNLYRGWTRVLYSTEVKLYPWIPEFVVTFLTKTALIESTTWVRRESEKVARKLDTKGIIAYDTKDADHFRPCFTENKSTGETGYTTKCSENMKRRKRNKDEL